MSDQNQATEEEVKGEEEMAKKAEKPARGRARKEEAAPEPKKEKKEEKKLAAKPAKTPKEPKEKKAPKAAYTIKGPKGVTVEQTKYLIVASSDGDKKKRIWVRGSTVGLTEKVSGLKGFKTLTEEEAKKNHLGKTRMIGKISDQEALNEIVSKFFG